jgi:hypothetical protein
MINVESGTPKTIKNAITIFIFLLPILSISYFLWIVYSIPLIFYIVNYREITQISWYVLFASYIFTAPMLIYINRSQALRFRSLGIGLFIFTTLLCCLSTNFVINLPTILDKEVLNDNTYYLTGELEAFDIHAYHRLFKCDNRHFHCEATPFWEDAGVTFKPLHLMIDKTHNNEVNVTYAGADGITRLIYTNNTPNLNYDDPVQLGNQFYYLVYFHNPEPRSSTYMLYQCNLDNTGCFRLPFEYLVIKVENYTGYDSIEAEANESTNEIKVIFKKDFDISTMKFAEETLIFTYNGQSHCYVEDCKILK